jgi:hypothetical protein
LDARLPRLAIEADPLGFRAWHSFSGKLGGADLVALPSSSMHQLPIIWHFSHMEYLNTIHPNHWVFLSGTPVHGRRDSWKHPCGSAPYWYPPFLEPISLIAAQAATLPSISTAETAKGDEVALLLLPALTRLTTNQPMLKGIFFAVAESAAGYVAASLVPFCFLCLILFRYENNHCVNAMQRSYHPAICFPLFK